MPNTHEVFSLITKGLIEADVFTDNATGSDLVAILPTEIVDQVLATVSKAATDEESQEPTDDVMKSAESVSPLEEKDMADAPVNFEDMDLPQEVADYIANLQASVHALSKAAADTKTEDEIVEDVLKSLDPAVASILKADRERTARLEAELATERAEKVRKTYLSKAAGYEYLTDDTEALANVLQAVAAKDPEAVEALTSILDIAEQRLEKSGLFEEVGSGADGTADDPYNRATAIAKTLVDEGHATSVEEARAMVWETQPELFDEYRRSLAR